MPPSPRQGFGWFDGDVVGESAATGGVDELAAPGSDSVPDPHPPRANAADTASKADTTNPGRIVTR
jgi:hypothetical protein